MHKIRDFVSFLLCFMLLAILGVTSDSKEKSFEPSDFKDRHVKIKNLSPILDDMRWKKSAKEIDEIEKLMKEKTIHIK